MRDYFISMATARKKIQSMNKKSPILSISFVHCSVYEWKKNYLQEC
jgi:hypothetical protein